MMRWKLWLAAACLLAIAAGAAPGAASKELPRGHWAYAVLDGLQKSGVATGYPEKAFSGERGLTREEFAVAVRRSAQWLSNVTERGGLTSSGRLRAAVLGKLGLGQVAFSPEMPRLAAEFAPELKQLGVEPQQLVRSQEPDDTGDPAARSSAYRVGMREADAEWKKGEVTIYSGGRTPTPFLDPQLGLPHQAAAGCTADQEGDDRLAGHNDQVHRLILRHGLPAGNKRAWLPEILEPVKYWRSVERPPVVLPLNGVKATSPDGTLQLRLRSDRGLPALYVARNGRNFVAEVRFLDDATRQVELQWGPARSELLFVRYLEREPKAREVYQVLETRTGRKLNLAFVAGGG